MRQASELEHAIMCGYLFTAFSLKQSLDEGLAPEQLAAVESWRGTILLVARQEMLHLALVQNLLTAIGAAPYLGRPNLPSPARHFPPGVRIALLPFGERALRHFLYLERPEGMPLADAEGVAAIERAYPVVEEHDLVPRQQDYATVGHLYRAIDVGFAWLAHKYGPEGLFVGPPEAQATAEHFGWEDLVAVTDLPSAHRAIDVIVEQGEGARGDWRKAHFGRFLQVLTEFTALRAAVPTFEPARPVVPGSIHADGGYPRVSDPGSAQVADLFNVVNEALLLALARFFAQTDETPAQRKTLADVSVGLMVEAIKPLGQRLTAFPFGPTHPGMNAAPTFELFYRTGYLLPHRTAAWYLVAERLREASEFARRVERDTGIAVADVAEALDRHGAALARGL